jgi:cyclin-dependent kinase 7
MNTFTIFMGGSKVQMSSIVPLLSDSDEDREVLNSTTGELEAKSIKWIKFEYLINFYNIFVEQRYVKTRRVGEGTFAVVYEALDTSEEPPKRVALKKIKMIKQEGNAPNGLDISAVRELKALRHLSCRGAHPNIAALLDVWLPHSSDQASGNVNLHFVLPFCDFDLEKLVKDSQIVFSPADIKSWMWMLLSGIEYCHERDILHRVNCGFLWILCSLLIFVAFRI